MNETVTRTRLLVVAALLWQDGRVLLSRRRVDQAMPHLWEFPGGKVEAGESPEDALAREVQEELGCQVTVGYACRLVSGVPRAVAVAEIDWVKPADLPARDLLPADFPLARRLAQEAALPKG